MYIGDRFFKPRVVFIISAFIYLVFATSSSLLGWRNPDKDWLVAIATHLPTLDPWSHERLIHIAPPLGAGFCCTPFLLFIIYPFILLSGWLAWTKEFVASVYSLPLLLVDVFSVYMVYKIVQKLKPKISLQVMSSSIIVLLFSGYFLNSSGFMGHPETLVVLFSLLGIRLLHSDKYLLGGVSFGLSLASKQSAVFIFIPVILLLLLKKDTFEYVFRFVLAAFVTVILFVLPFFIAYPFDTWYGIVGYPQFMTIQGPNIWWFIESFSRRLLGLNQVSALLIKIANPILLGASFFISILFLRLRKISLKDQTAFGLIALVLLGSNIFSKWLAFHHFLPTFVFLIIWDVLRKGSNFPVFAYLYAFLLFVAFFINNPFWQFGVLLINIIAFVYVFLVMYDRKNIDINYEV